MSIVSVKTAAWYGDRDVSLSFPESWPVHTVAFQNRPVLTDSQMRDAFLNPVGSPRVSEMAKGRKSAVILADDLTRPTPASKVIPFRLNSEEAARLAGLDATALTILNNAREVTGLVVGDVVKAHRTAVDIAREAYAVHPITDADVVVSTGYPRDHDLKYSRQGTWPFEKTNGAAKILVASGDEGVGYHRMGIINAKKRRLAEDRERENLSIPRKLKSTNYLLLSQAVGPSEVRDVHPNAELIEEWETARTILEDQFRGRIPKVAVYPSSAISYPADN